MKKKPRQGGGRTSAFSLKKRGRASKKRLPGGFPGEESSAGSNGLLFLGMRP